MVSINNDNKLILDIIAKYYIANSWVLLKRIMDNFNIHVMLKYSVLMDILNKKQ